MIKKAIVTRLFGFNFFYSPYETKEGELRHFYELNKKQCDKIFDDGCKFIEEMLKNLEVELKEKGKEEKS